MYLQVVERRKGDPNGAIRPVGQMYYSEREILDKEYGSDDPGLDFLIVQYDDKGFYKVMFAWDGSSWKGV